MHIRAAKYLSKSTVAALQGMRASVFPPLRGSMSRAVAAEDQGQWNLRTPSIILAISSLSFLIYM